MGSTSNPTIPYPEGTDRPAASAIRLPVLAIHNAFQTIYQRFARTAEIEASGAVSITLSDEPGKTANISYPSGRFGGQIPHLQLTKATSGLAKCTIYYQSNTSTGATVGVYAGDGTNQTGTVSIAWRAYLPI